MKKNGRENLGLVTELARDAVVEVVEVEEAEDVESEAFR